MSKLKPRHVAMGHESISETPSTTNEAQIQRSTLPKWAMIALSIFGVVHVLAVYAEPFRFSTAAESPMPAADAMLLQRTLRPYIDFMYLNHGYYFFAPNPGPAHLVACDFTDNGAGQGTNNIDPPSKQLLFPDKSKHWPRLMYHRYFMYSEFYHSLFVPQDMPLSEPDGRPLPAEMFRGKELYAALNTSLRNYVEHRYPSKSYHIYRLERALPTPEEYFDQQIQLNDPRLLTEIPETFEAEESLSDTAPATLQMPVSPDAVTPLITN
jgi:hypothetical protein